MRAYQVFYLECLFILLPKTKRNFSVFLIYSYSNLFIFFTLKIRSLEIKLFCFEFYLAKRNSLIGCEIKVSFITSEQLQ